MAYLKHYLLVLLCTLVDVLIAIDVKSAEESPCLNISRAVDPDDAWFSSVDKWYYPLASRLDLYRSVHDLLETSYENIPEYSVYYDSCLEWKINSEGFRLMGFNGRTRLLRTTPVSQGTSDFKSEWPQGMVGRAYTTLTDNKTFAFTAACFADNQMSWNVFATTKTLDEATKHKIFEHAKSLGYNPDYFTEMRYDTCRNQYSEGTSIINMKSSMTEAKTESIMKPTKTAGVSGKSFLCNACKKMCPNMTVKKPNMPFKDTLCNDISCAQ